MPTQRSLNLLSGRAEQVFSFVGLDVQRGGTHRHARQVEELAHEGVEPVRLFFNHFGALVAAFGHLVCETFDRRKRRAEIVRDSSKNSVLQPIRLLQRHRALGVRGATLTPAPSS